MKSYEELEHLISRLGDGELTDQERARFNEILRGDPDACEHYLNRVALDAQLENEFGGFAVKIDGGQSELRDSPKTRLLKAECNIRSTRVTWVMRVAAVVMMACGIGLTARWWTMRSESRAARVWVGTVLFAEDCEWDRELPIKEGERLEIGSVHLLSGTAIVRFDGGAEVVLRGDTELELSSATLAVLKNGDVLVRAEADAAGFKLVTPSQELTDLGTEFEVRVDRSGATELHVIEGEVAHAPLNQSTPAAVADAGNALRFDRKNSAPKPVSLTALRFADLVKQANPRERRDLMTVYEGFHYEPGRYPPSVMDRGIGWAGPWRLRSHEEWQGVRETDFTEDMKIIEGKLDVAWPVADGKVGMLEMPEGRAFRIRPMAKPIDMHHDGITYFSLMTYEANHELRKDHLAPQESIRLTFRSSHDYWDESLSFGIGPKGNPQIDARPFGNVKSPAVAPNEQSLLWVGKIIRRSNGEDEIFLRIYGQTDLLDYAEPATWHVVTRGVQQRNAYDLVVISSMGASARIVDELRIGPSWRSVVPIQTKLPLQVSLAAVLDAREQLPEQSGLGD